MFNQQEEIAAMKLQLATGLATALSLAAPAYTQNFGASGFSAKERAAFTAPAHAQTTTKTKVVHTRKHKTRRTISARGLSRGNAG